MIKRFFLHDYFRQLCLMSQPTTLLNNKRKTKNIAIFASGAGTNAAKIVDHFKNHPDIKVLLIVTNNSTAGVLNIAEKNNIKWLLIDRQTFLHDHGYVDELKQHNVDFIVLAGFLWKVPQTLIDAYRNRIINIHPALLPKYGGKGMYGNKVHEAVLAANEEESGITIHYVDEHYDNGDVIFQQKCPVLKDDTAETLAIRIHQLEHTYFPVIVEECVSKL